MSENSSRVQQSLLSVPRPRQLQRGNEKEQLVPCQCENHHGRLSFFCCYSLEAHLTCRFFPAENSYFSVVLADLLMVPRPGLSTDRATCFYSSVSRGWGGDRKEAYRSQGAGSAAVTNTLKSQWPHNHGSSLAGTASPPESAGLCPVLSSCRTRPGDRPPSAALLVTTQPGAWGARGPDSGSCPQSGACYVHSLLCPDQAGGRAQPHRSRGRRPTASRGRTGSVLGLGTGHRGSPPQRHGQEGGGHLTCTPVTRSCF